MQTAKQSFFKNHRKLWNVIPSSKRNLSTIFHEVLNEENTFMNISQIMKKC